jgi:hypothetical protein
MELNEQVDQVRLIVPDTGVLTALAQEDKLDLLFSFTKHVHLVITDVVEFESTLKAELVEAQRIQQFLTKNSNRVLVQPTNFHAYLDAAKQGAILPGIQNMGPLSIYGLFFGLDAEIDASARPTLPTTTIVLFQDVWFNQHHTYRPRAIRVLSMAEFRALALDSTLKIAIKNGI